MRSAPAVTKNFGFVSYQAALTSIVKSIVVDRSVLEYFRKSFEIGKPDDNAFFSIFES